MAVVNKKWKDSPLSPTASCMKMMGMMGLPLLLLLGYVTKQRLLNSCSLHELVRGRGFTVVTTLRNQLRRDNVSGTHGGSQLCLKGVWKL